MNGAAEMNGAAQMQFGDPVLQAVMASRNDIGHLMAAVGTLVTRVALLETAFVQKAQEFDALKARFEASGPENMTATEARALADASVADFDASNAGFGA